MLTWGLERLRKVCTESPRVLRKSSFSRKRTQARRRLLEERGAGHPKVATVSGSRALSSSEGDYFEKGTQGRPSGRLYGMPAPSANQAVGAATGSGVSGEGEDAEAAAWGRPEGSGERLIGRVKPNGTTKRRHVAPRTQASA